MPSGGSGFQPQLTPHTLCDKEQMVVPLWARFLISEVGMLWDEMRKQV